MKEMYREIAMRLKDLREIFQYSFEDMAKFTETPIEEYKLMESGDSDFSYTFLHKAAKTFHVDITDLISGESPRLSSYFIVRKDQGMPITRRIGFDYQSLNSLFKNKIMEPFVVKVDFREEALKNPIPLSTHGGQELNYVLSGEMKISVDGHEDILKAGDSIYYNSQKPHGMIANSKDGVTFLAVVADDTE